MKKFFFTAVLFASVSLAAAPAPPPGSGEMAAAINEIASELSRISGLEQLRPVQYDLIPRERVKPFLEQRVKESVKPDELRAEETALKKLGFVPQDFDLAKSTVDLLSEQAAAFYDYHKKRLFLIDNGTDVVQHSALVHELAHALADQHFHLERFIERANKDDDSALARMAVMEGQATWLMSEYLTKQTGQSLRDSPVLVKMMSNAGETSTGQFPVFDEAPLYLRETLIFPYTQGMLFQHAVVEKLDKRAFSEVFRRPPVSTQQVLHPEKYFENVKSTRPALPSLVTRQRYKEFTNGELGELDHRILLRQYVGEEAAAAMAPEWRGGYFRLLESKHGPVDAHGFRRDVLAYASEWSSPAQARKFFDLYQKVLAGKWKRLEPGHRDENVFTGRGDDGYFEVRLQGAVVTSLEGMESESEVHAKQVWRGYPHCGAHGTVQWR